MKKITKICSWSFPDRESIPDGYNVTQIPKATAENMVVLMATINELINRVNELTPNLED